ncbi:MAG TPA: hypothetical protein IAC03_02725 [Candidatus Coprenecus pullistercoris]|nr:hypothetical protein [Candidatus Coprenecus pullistercoris]
MQYGKFYRILSGLLPLALLSCGSEGGHESLNPIAEKALNDTASVYYNDFSAYRRDISALPVGVFGCGVNSFGVTEELLAIDCFDNITGALRPDGIADFGGENIQLLTDLANGPYEGYVSSGNVDYLQEQVLRNALFLMGGSYYNLVEDEYRSGYKEPVKLIIVSSPTADLYGMSVLDAFLKESGTGVKAVGVTEAAVKEAVSDIDEEGHLCVGVMYPPDGVSSIEYEKMIRQMAASKNQSADRIQILNQEAVGLAAAINGDTAYVDTVATAARSSYAGPVTGISYNNIDISLFDRYGFETSGHALLYARRGTLSGVQLNSVENYVRFHLVSMIERHRRSGSTVPISSIILVDPGYSQAVDIMRQVVDELYNFKRGGVYLYRNSISPDVKFINPAESAVMEAYRILRQDNHLALRGEKTELMPFVSMPSGSLSADALNADGSMKDSFKFGRQSGTEDISTKVVPFAPGYVGEDLLNYVGRNSSRTFSMIRNSLY